MNRKELIRRIDAVLRENNIRKPVSLPKQVFHISDDEGHTKDFTVKKFDKMVMYTVDDIDAILEACGHVVRDAIRSGEEIHIKGLGALILRYHKPTIVSNNVLDGAKIAVDGHYVPKIILGTELRRCAQVYEQSLKDTEIISPPPPRDDGE